MGWLVWRPVLPSAVVEIGTDRIGLCPHVIVVASVLKSLHCSKIPHILNPRDKTA